MRIEIYDTTCILGSKFTYLGVTKIINSLFLESGKSSQVVWCLLFLCILFWSENRKGSAVKFLLIPGKHF
ncbi:unnamed protein product [Coffea canephora]|uniref:Uncharacterized protein n=1 Tax=Coffea canephora TaxID=49390 RepID=A0A068V4W6_COFCA|nr:unnamed protein product [Coffea canephora]